MANPVQVAVTRAGGIREVAYRLGLGEGMIRHMIRRGVITPRDDRGRQRVRILAELSGVPALALVGLMPDWQPEGEAGGGAAARPRAKRGLRLAEPAAPAPAGAGPRAEWHSARPGRVSRPRKPGHLPAS